MLIKNILMNISLKKNEYRYSVVGLLLFTMCNTSPVSPKEILFSKIFT